LRRVVHFFSEFSCVCLIALLALNIILLAWYGVVYFCICAILQYFWHLVTCSTPNQAPINFCSSLWLPRPASGITLRCASTRRCANFKSQRIQRAAIPTCLCRRRCSAPTAPRAVPRRRARVSFRTMYVFSKMRISAAFPILEHQHISHHDSIFSSLFVTGLDMVSKQYGGDSIVIDAAAVGVYFVGIVAAGSPTTYFAAAAAPITCPPPPPVGPPPRIGSGTILMLVVLGIACLLALVGAYMWWQRRQRKRSLSQGFAILGDDASSASAAANVNAGALTEDSYARLDRPPIIAMDS
jgi:hypothetical protein